MRSMNKMWFKESVMWLANENKLKSLFETFPAFEFAAIYFSS